jgi:hypothetical protein
MTISKRLLPEQRYWRKIARVESGCWEWQGALNSMGYGVISFNSRPMYAHRFVFERTFGGLRPGVVVMHSCDNPRCVRPAHLSAGTQKDNSRDMVEKGRTNNQPKWSRLYCRRNHRLTPDNVYVENRATGKTYRKCRICGDKAARAREGK